MADSWDDDSDTVSEVRSSAVASELKVDHSDDGGDVHPSEAGKTYFRFSSESVRHDLPGDEAALIAEETRLRGSLAMFESSAASTDTATVSSPADVARKKARLLYKLWGLGLRKMAVEDTRAAYETALSFDANATNPVLWLEMCMVYQSYGAYSGANSMLSRYMTDFPKDKHMPTAMMLRVALLRHEGRHDETVPMLKDMVVDVLPRGYGLLDILFLIAWSHDTLASRTSHVESAMNARALSDAGFRDCWAEATGKEIDTRKVDSRWKPWRNDPQVWIGVALVHVRAKNYMLACEAFAEALRLRELTVSDDDVAWRREKPLWMLATRCAVRSGDEGWGDLFGRAILRAMGANGSVLEQLVKEGSSRDLIAVYNAGGALARQVQSRAAILAGTMCLTLRSRAKRSLAARRIQWRWRWRCVNQFVMRRRRARFTIGPIAKGFAGRLYVRRMHRSSDLIKGLWYMWRDRTHVRAAIVERRSRAVAVLHRSLPCMPAMGHLAQHRRAARKIQATFRMFQCRLLIILMKSDREAIVHRLKQATQWKQIGSVVMPGELVRQYLPAVMWNRRKLVYARNGSKGCLPNQLAAAKPEMDAQMTVDSMWARAREMQAQLETRFSRRRAKGDRRRAKLKREPWREERLMDMGTVDSLAGFGSSLLDGGTGTWGGPEVDEPSSMYGEEEEEEEGDSDEDGEFGDDRGGSSSDDSDTSDESGEEKAGDDDDDAKAEAQILKAAEEAEAARRKAEKQKKEEEEEERRRLRRLTRRNRRRRRRKLIDRSIDVSVLTNTRPTERPKVRRPKADATLDSHIAYCLDSGSETDDGAAEAPTLLADTLARDPTAHKIDPTVAKAPTGAQLFEFSSESEAGEGGKEKEKGRDDVDGLLGSETDSVSSFSDESVYDLQATGAMGEHVFNAIDTALGRTAVRSNVEGDDYSDDGVGAGGGGGHVTFAAAGGGAGRTLAPPTLPGSSSTPITGAGSKLLADREAFRRTFKDKARIGEQKTVDLRGRGTGGGWGRPVTEAPTLRPATIRPNHTCYLKPGTPSVEARVSYVGPMRSILLEALFWMRVEPSAWRELLQRRLLQFERAAKGAHHGGCTRDTCDVIWRVGRLNKLLASEKNDPKPMASAIKRVISAWETEWEVYLSSQTSKPGFERPMPALATMDGAKSMPHGLTSTDGRPLPASPTFGSTDLLTPALLKTRGPGSSLLPPLDGTGTVGGSVGTLGVGGDLSGTLASTMHAATLPVVHSGPTPDVDAGLEGIEVHNSAMLRHQLQQMSMLRAFYNRMLFTEINRRQWHSAGDVLRRQMLERDMTPTYNTLLSVEIALNQLTTGNTRKPKLPIPDAPFTTTAETTAAVDPADVHSLFDMDRLRSAADVAVAAFRHATSIALQTEEIALSMLTCFPVTAGWWHLVLAWHDIVVDAKLSLTPKLRKALIKACASIVREDRHLLYKGLQAVGAPYQLAVDGAMVGMSSFFERHTAMYGFGIEAAHDFTAGKDVKTGGVGVGGGGGKGKGKAGGRK